ncbi:uncharacterized protein MELLADRAFT_84526 [Melampsora larici-populina 98AG31]|uniref:Uncharacterized protein n=1 Tax=Melampsora larici-populina (strain 98AG31 / pathotype 3-4-7) TaxID=747676 RepID=F4SCC2_MELLP|nr:uncharacterized protein MELLADRAFT_84526 [Melampsora larici-populina 98AG31]EGF97707.1 hypothetical protein MELLADRAFT_84526 [Melampsora larici-populina 98AG31]
MGPGPEMVVEGPVSYSELPPPEVICPSRDTSGTKATVETDTPCSPKDDVLVNKVTLGVGLSLAPQGERLTDVTGGTQPQGSMRMVQTSQPLGHPNDEVICTSSQPTEQNVLPPSDNTNQTHTYLEKGKWKATTASTSTSTRPRYPRIVDESTTIFERRVPKPKEDTIIQNGRTYRRGPYNKDTKLTGKEMRARRLEMQTKKAISERKQRRIDTHYEHHIIKVGKKKRPYFRSDIGNIIRHSDEPPNDEGHATTTTDTPIVPPADANAHSTRTVASESLPGRPLRGVNAGMLTSAALFDKLKSNTTTSRDANQTVPLHHHLVNTPQLLLKVVLPMLGQTGHRLQREATMNPPTPWG